MAALVSLFLFDPAAYIGWAFALFQAVAAAAAAVVLGFSLGERKSWAILRPSCLFHDNTFSQRSPIVSGRVFSPSLSILPLYSYWLHLPSPSPSNNTPELLNHSLPGGG